MTVRSIRESSDRLPVPAPDSFTNSRSGRSRFVVQQHASFAASAAARDGSIIAVGSIHHIGDCHRLNGYRPPSHEYSTQGSLHICHQLVKQQATGFQSIAIGVVSRHKTFVAPPEMHARPINRVSQRIVQHQAQRLRRPNRQTAPHPHACDACHQAIVRRANRVAPRQNVARQPESSDLYSDTQ